MLNGFVLAVLSSGGEYEEDVAAFVDHRFFAMLTQVKEVRWRRDEGRLEGCHGVSLAKLAVWLVNCTLSIAA